jgi:hypothetical protein
MAVPGSDNGPPEVLRVPNDRVVTWRRRSRSGAIRDLVVWMPSHFRFNAVRVTARTTIAAAACSTALSVGAWPAAAAPSSDGQGYINSTARCASSDQTVAFGSTEASRVAICEMASGSLEYRGVRVRDGARLILPASQSSAGTFVADNDGVSYTVTSNSLEVSAGTRVIREETMVDFHGPESSEQPTTEQPTTTSTPEGPPLPAEVGGSGS